MSPKKNKGRWLFFAAMTIVAVVAVGAAMINGSGKSAPAGSNVATFAARRGPLTISVTESGTIKSQDQRILKSQVEGQTTIIFLAPEGKIVKVDDLLVELDASKLIDEKDDRLIKMQNAEAAFIRSRENLEVVKSQGESDVSVAKLDYQFAQEDLKQYLEGEYPKQLKELESKITLAKEELEQAAEELEWSKTLLEEKYVSESEHKQNELTYNRSQLDHELAVANRDLLRDYTYKRKVAELESDVEQTKMALDRKIRKARADNVQAEADLKAKQSEFKQQQDKLAKIEDQITKTKIRAPIAGMVVYASSAKGSWRGNAEPLDEGQSVRERQELIYLPTADAMMVETKVHESVLDKVSLDLSVKVTIDALPGKHFSGRVSKIAPLPDAASMWMNPDLKVYNTHIVLDGSQSDLRTGMSCQAQIIVDQLTDAVYVPVQSVVRVGRQPTVYVKRGDVIEPRDVELGMDNNRMAHIKSGLEAGELVLLTPPLSTAAARLPGDEEGMPTTAQEAEKNPDAESDSAANDRGDRPRRERGEGEGRRRSRGDGERSQRNGEGRRRSRGEGDGSQGGNDARSRMQNMTPEQREQMRKQIENMTPEQREQLRKQYQGGGGG